MEVFDGAKHKSLGRTLGTIYECSVSSLIDGSCDYREECTAGSLNPVFQVHRGPVSIDFSVPPVTPVEIPFRAHEKTVVLSLSHRYRGLTIVISMLFVMRSSS